MKEFEPRTRDREKISYRLRPPHMQRCYMLTACCPSGVGQVAQWSM